MEIDISKVVRNPEHCRMLRNVLNDVLNGGYTPEQADMLIAKIKADDPAQCFIGKGRYVHEAPSNAAR